MKYSVVYFILFFSSSLWAVEASPVSYSGSLFKMMLGLFSVIALIFIVVWLIKRTGMAGLQSNDLIRIKACLPLSTKEKLLLIDVSGEQFLIGVSPGGISHLKDFKEPVFVEASDKTISSDFSEKLKAILQKKSSVE